MHSLLKEVYKGHRTKASWSGSWYIWKIKLSFRKRMKSYICLVKDHSQKNNRTADLFPCFDAVLLQTWPQEIILRMVQEIRSWLLTVWPAEPTKRALVRAGTPSAPFTLASKTCQVSFSFTLDLGWVSSDLVTQMCKASFELLCLLITVSHSTNYHLLKRLN